MDKSFYMVFSSSQSKKEFPNNRPSNFYINLPEYLQLGEGDWEVALTNLYCSANTNAQMFVTCDLCDMSSVLEKKLPLLIHLKPKTPINNLLFVPVHTKSFNTVHLSLLSIQLNEFSVSGTTICTLYFRPVQKRK